MFNFYPFIFFFIFLINSCHGNENKTVDSGFSTFSGSDSLKIVSDYFLIYDIYINSYVVSDRDIDETYQDKKSWVKKYFPIILKEYDLTLYSQFTLSCYLYLEGEKKYIQDLWNKHKRLAGNKEKNIEPNIEFKPIINLLKEFKIPISSL